MRLQKVHSCVSGIDVREIASLSVPGSVVVVVVAVVRRRCFVVSFNGKSEIACAVGRCRPPGNLDFPPTSGFNFLRKQPALPGHQTVHFRHVCRPGLVAVVEECSPAFASGLFAMSAASRAFWAGGQSGLLVVLPATIRCDPG